MACAKHIYLKFELVIIWNIRYLKFGIMNITYDFGYSAVVKVLKVSDERMLEVLLFGADAGLTDLRMLGMM